MRYASIEAEVSNGNDFGISLYVQGCHFHCKGCFNEKTWDFNGGSKWTEETKLGFFTLLDNNYIKRVTIIGGEPLADENVDDVLGLVKEIRERFPNKVIWLYTGYTINSIIYPVLNDDFFVHKKRREIIENVDILVDGKFEEDKKDFTLQFRGSSNQRLIDVQKTLKNNKIEIWMNGA